MKRASAAQLVQLTGSGSGLLHSAVLGDQPQARLRMSKVQERLQNLGTKNGFKLVNSVVC